MEATTQVRLTLDIGFGLAAEGTDEDEFALAIRLSRPAQMPDQPIDRDVVAETTEQLGGVIFFFKQKTAYEVP